MVVRLVRDECPQDKLHDFDCKEIGHALVGRDDAGAVVREAPASAVLEVRMPAMLGEAAAEFLDAGHLPALLDMLLERRESRPRMGRVQRDVASCAACRTRAMGRDEHKAVAHARRGRAHTVTKWRRKTGSTGPALTWVHAQHGVSARQPRRQQPRRQRAAARGWGARARGETALTTSSSRSRV